MSPNPIGNSCRFGVEDASTIKLPAETLEQFGHELCVIGPPRFQPGFAVRTGSNHEVLYDLLIFRFQQRCINRNRFQLTHAVHNSAHQSAARHPFHFHGRESLLQFGGAALHFLDLLHEIWIHPLDSSSGTATAGSNVSGSRTLMISAPGNASSTARTNGSCAAASFRARSAAIRLSAIVRPPPSVASVTIQRRPVHCWR